jgi:hypothetical protein
MRAWITLCQRSVRRAAVFTLGLKPLPYGASRARNGAQVRMHLAEVVHEPHLAEVHHLSEVPSLQERQAASVFTAYCAGRTMKQVADVVGIGESLCQAILDQESARRRALYKARPKCPTKSCGKRHGLFHLLTDVERASMPICVEG